jgi:uncharacterized protein
MASNTEKLEDILENFLASTADVEGVAVVTPDGLSLASSLPVNINEQRVSAMSVAMLSLAERIGKELARGDIYCLSVEGEEGLIILTSCGEKAVFIILATKTAKQGFLMLDIKRTLAKIKPILSDFIPNERSSKVINQSQFFSGFLTKVLKKLGLYFDLD